MRLDHSADFSGVVAGFDGNDVLDLGDISAANATFNFTANEAGTGGTLQVTDSTHTANINLQGQYATENLHASADTTNGTMVSYVLTA